jgi:serine protease Do
MSKKQIAFLVLIIVVAVLVVDLLVGNYVSAKISTNSWVRKWGLFNPLAPIVVTNRETVRVDTNNDLVETAENAKSKVATLIYFDGSDLVVTGSAVNWTSDGYFVTSASGLATAGKVYGVVTANGDVYPVEAAYPDPASNLVVLQTAAKDLSVLSPSEPNDLRVGQQVVMVQNSLGNNQTQFATGYIQRLASDVVGDTAESDLVSRNLELIALGTIPTGSAVLDLSGRMIGIWDGDKVVMADEVRALVNNLLANAKSFARPEFGFSYQILNEVEAKTLQTTSGARVRGVASGSQAAGAGLRGGDVITEVDGQKLDGDLNFDAWLRQVKPDQVISLSVQRGTNSVSILLTAEKL